MSVMRTCLSFSITSPIEMPATGRLIGTPASIIASVPPHTDAIELEPFDSRISLTRRIVYGNRVAGGGTGLGGGAAHKPGALSRRPRPPVRLAFPARARGEG